MAKGMSTTNAYRRTFLIQAEDTTFFALAREHLIFLKRISKKAFLVFSSNRGLIRKYSISIWAMGFLTSALYSVDKTKFQNKIMIFFVVQNNKGIQAEYVEYHK